MPIRLLLLEAVLLLILCSHALAAGNSALGQLRAQLPIAGDVLIDNTDAAALIPGSAEGSYGEMISLNPDPAVPSLKALRMHVGRAYQPKYQVQVLSTKTTAAVHKGDTVLISCWLRVPEDMDEAPGIIVLRLQMDHAPWTAPAETSANCARAWKQIITARVSDQDYAPGALQLTFHIGQQRQVLDFASVAVLNLGRNVDLAKLPRTPITWPGMETNAPWRAQAAERIQRYRMADLSVQVRDAAGKPLPGVQLHIKQKRQAFTVGSFVEFARPVVLLSDSPDGEKSRAVYARLFNRATCPIYWADWGWPSRKEDFLAIAQWLHQRDYATRGHVMVYPAFEFLPAELQSLKNDPVQLRAKILEHIRTIAESTKPFAFREYDVTNELRDCTDLHRILGRDAVAEWYAEARRDLPGIKMALNENTILTDGGATLSNQDVYLDWYRFLKSKGQAPDVLGFQSHFNEAFTAPETVWAILDRFSKETTADLQITEFDINTLDEQAQAAYTRDFMTACFAHPRVSAFTFWGFWEGGHWIPRAALYRKDWSLKPNGKVVEELLTKTWRTDVMLTTDKDGRANAKAFLGVQQLSAEVGGRKIVSEVKLDHAGDSQHATLQATVKD